MHTLRNAHLIARCVLVWFALSIGVAIASPLVQPRPMQLVCSASGGLQAITVDANGQAQPAAHTLDCPLCAGVGAPPSMAPVFFSAAAPRQRTLPAPDGIAFACATTPTARGPPAQA
jgi:hypothetical protein